MKRTFSDLSGTTDSTRAQIARTAGKLKRVWCIRHGQTEVNVGMIEEQRSCKAEGRPWVPKESKALHIPDVALTALGQHQAQVASTDPVISNSALAPPGDEECAQLVVVSPLRRTLQTALGLCRAAAARTADTSTDAMVILAHPDLQECGTYPCDTGRPIEELKAEFGEEEIDFSILAASKEPWFEKRSLWGTPPMNELQADPEGLAALQARCARFSAWLAARPEERVIVVAHHTLFCHLLNMDLMNCEVVEMALHLDKDQVSWHPVQASSMVVPFYTKDGQPITVGGSNPLSGSLAACLTKYGMAAAQETAKRAGLPDPSIERPAFPAVPATY